MVVERLSWGWFMDSFARRDFQLKSEATCNLFGTLETDKTGAWKQCCQKSGLKVQKIQSDSKQLLDISAAV